MVVGSVREEVGQLSRLVSGGERISLEEGEDQEMEMVLWEIAILGKRMGLLSACPAC